MSNTCEFDDNESQSSPAQIKILEVPKDRILEVKRLIDKSDQEITHESRYHLWTLISETFPEEDFMSGNWAINSGYALRVFVELSPEKESSDN